MTKIFFATRTDLTRDSNDAKRAKSLIELLHSKGHILSVSSLQVGAWDGPFYNEEKMILREFIAKNEPEVIIADSTWMTPVFDLSVKPIKKVCFVNDIRYQFDWELQARFLKKADILLITNKNDLQMCNRLAHNVKTVTTYDDFLKELT